MVPFIMRDPGDLRREELLAIGEHFALLKNLPTARRRDDRLPRRLTATLREVLQGMVSDCLRCAPSASIAGNRQ